MPENFNDEECYELFIAIDTRARVFRGTHLEVNALRERLLPYYKAWHDANPNEVHPGALPLPDDDPGHFMDPGPMSEGFGRRLRDPWG